MMSNHDSISSNTNRLFEPHHLPTPPELRKILIQFFNLNELRNLCHDLGISYETLQHTTLDELARELVSYYERRALFGDLISAVAHVRPNALPFALNPTPRSRPDEIALPGTRTSSTRVFISYTRDVVPDEPLAHEIAQALRTNYNIFTDQELPVDTRWAERIHEELRRSDAMIVMLSEHGVGSEMLKEELRTAYALAQVQGGRPVILPIRVAYRQPFEYPLSFYLNDINWALWRGPEDTPILIAHLQRALDGGMLPVQVIAEKVGLLEPQQKVVGETMRPTAAAQPVFRPEALELPEGTMPIDSVLYIERPVDTVALDAIRRFGVTMTIKGPRQMGKSSLLMRAISAATEAEKQVAFFDFQLFDHTTLASADQFFRQFCVWLSDSLGLPDRTDDYWSSPLGNPQRATNYVSRFVLKEVSGHLVLAMDEVESIFDTDFRSDFFGMLRSWHNNRAYPHMPIWKRLDLALVTSTEPYQLIADLNQSPFNIGVVIDLDDFTPAQVADLNRRHGTPFAPAKERELIALLNGHPYLTRRALYLVASRQIEVAELFAQASNDRGPFGDHLRYHMFRLHGQKLLIHSLLQAIQAGTCDDEHVFFRLHGAGLIRREGKSIRPRCALYASYFREHLHL